MVPSWAELGEPERFRGTPQCRSDKHCGSFYNRDDRGHISGYRNWDSDWHTPSIKTWSHHRFREIHRSNPSMDLYPSEWWDSHPCKPHECRYTDIRSRALCSRQRGTLVINVASDTASRLVAETATLDGTLEVVPFPGFGSNQELKHSLF